MRKLSLKRGEDRRVRRGHYWIFANEIAEPLKQYIPGESVSVVDNVGRPVGSGTVNPHSLIAVRLHSKRADEPLDEGFIERKLTAAWNTRKRLGYTDVCRICHGEPDGLPGLIIDRYGDFFSVQHNCVGVDRMRDHILEILDKMFSPKAVLAADDSPARELEHLPLERGIAGEVDADIVWYRQDNLDWPLDLGEGQKTGSYLDQVEARRQISKYAKDARVLDGFSYTGGFGMLAAKHGASEILLSDRSEHALEIAKEAFKRNNLLEPQTLKVDLLHDEITAKDLGGQFDLTILDPPPLVKNKNRLAEGLRRYETLFMNGCLWTKPEGLAAYFSCSHHVSRENLLESVRRAERRSKRRVKRLGIMTAGPDHPVSIDHPESEYLHGFLLQIG